MRAETNAVSLALIANWNCLDPKAFESQYRNHLSDFNEWDQKDHAEDWLLYEQNIGSHLSLDETSISNGELYTILTNKIAKGRKGSIIATCKGTKTKDIANVFKRISPIERQLVREVTLDFSSSMKNAVIESFPNARITTDRFHVQKLVTEAVQDMRIELRHEALKSENGTIKKAREQCKKHGKQYKHPKLKTYSNGDTKKQLLARSRYLLFKPKSKWTDSQKERAVILFEAFPELKSAYNLSMMFRNIYEQAKTKQEAKELLNKWHAKVGEKNFPNFITTAEYIQNHEDTILNYFPDRSTNAAAESFNAKLKGFRSLVRGVRDKKFFLYRVSKIWG